MIYHDEFFNEILNSNDLKLDDQLLINCQEDLFQLLNQKENDSMLRENERRQQLRWFLGYYSLIHERVDFLFQMESFLEKFVDFLVKLVDVQRLIREKNIFLNERSSKNENVDETFFKHFLFDVHDDLEQLIEIFLRSNDTFSSFLIEQIDEKNIFDERTTKIFYFLSIVYEKRRSIPSEEFQILFRIFSRIISDDDKRKVSKKQRKTFGEKKEISTKFFNEIFIFFCSFIDFNSKFDDFSSFTMF